MRRDLFSLWHDRSLFNKARSADVAVLGVIPCLTVLGRSSPSVAFAPDISTYTIHLPYLRWSFGLVCDNAMHAVSTVVYLLGYLQVLSLRRYLSQSLASGSIGDIFFNSPVATRVMSVIVVLISLSFPAGARTRWVSWNTCVLQNNHFRL